MAKNTYIKAQEEATKAALEATDKANVAKSQAEEVLAKMQKYFQQLIIESVVAIKNSKRPLSPAPATITESPETKEKQQKKQRGKTASPEPVPATPAVPERAKSVTPKRDTRSRSRETERKRAQSAENYKPFRGTPHRLSFSPIREKPSRAKSKARPAAPSRARPAPSRAPSARPSQAPELTVVPAGPSSSREVSITPARAKSIKPSRPRSKSGESLVEPAAIGPTPSGSKKTRRVPSQAPVNYEPTKNDPYTQYPVDS
jgi:hypothetical protein